MNQQEILSYISRRTTLMIHQFNDGCWKVSGLVEDLKYECQCPTLDECLFRICKYIELIEGKRERGQYGLITMTEIDNFLEICDNYAGN